MGEEGGCWKSFRKHRIFDVISRSRTRTPMCTNFSFLRIFEEEFLLRRFWVWKFLRSSVSPRQIYPESLNFICTVSCEQNMIHWIWVDVFVVSYGPNLRLKSFKLDKYELMYTLSRIRLVEEEKEGVSSSWCWEGEEEEGWTKIWKSSNTISYSRVDSDYECIQISTSRVTFEKSWNEI